MVLLDDLHARIHNRSAGWDVCFYCARSYARSQMTDEHVFPKWLLHAFDLWEEKLTLPNGTSISYRQLVVPCCALCNNHYLSRLDNVARSVYKFGQEKVQPSRLILYHWISKIFYGLIYKDFFLRADRAYPELGTIASLETLNRYSDHLEFMQEARDELVFAEFNPFSLFAFECQEASRQQVNFDYIDDTNSAVVGIRMGKVGLVLVTSDGGIQQPFDKVLYEEAPHPLHPIQFRELCAKVIYKEHLRDRSPKYITIASEHITPTLHQLPLAGYSLKPFYREWNMEHYAQVLAQYTGYPVEELFSPPDRVWTWISDQTGQPLFMPVEA